MDEVMKLKVIPVLRASGFKGSYPNLKRIKEDQIDLIGFQFSQWGPQLYINIAIAPKEGITLLNGKHFPPDKLKYYHSGKRTRLGESHFDFEDESFEEIANQIILCLPKGELWWSENK